MEKLNNFCGFNTSADSFGGKYIFNESSLNLTPCGELLFTTIDHYIFAFFIILNYFHVKYSPYIPSPIVKFIISFKLFITFSTCIIILTSFILGYFGEFPLKDAQLIEYVFIVIIWLLFGFIWIFSIYYKRWPHSVGLSISYGMASKAFIVIGVQRLMIYGAIDYRTLSIFLVLSLHAINYVFCVVEFFMARKYQNFHPLHNDTSSTADFISEEEDDGTDESASFFSQIFYCWTNVLIKKGYHGEIQQVNDLYKLPPSLRIVRVERRFFESASTQFTDAQPFSLAFALTRAFGLVYFSLGLLCFISDCLKFAGPILLHLLIASFEKNDEYGYLYATFMLLSSFLSSLSSFNFNFYVNKVALKVRCALLSAVYDKLLQIPQCRLTNFSTGQLINFMSTDVDRISGFFTSFHAVWSMPMNLAIALYLLYTEVGLAFVAGLLAAIITIPVNKYIATKIGEMSTKMMHYKDQRMRIISEAMRAIRVVKLNNWESFFENKINELREKELKYLKMRKYLDAVCVYLWASAPILITIAILTTYTLLFKEELTAAKVFTSLALVNILILPLNAFPWVLNSVVEAYVSKKRFDKFFAIENVDPFSLYRLADQEKLLQVDNANFSWHNDRFSVKNFSVSSKKGTIIGVMGPVGCGKSTILLGILGETECNETKSIRIQQQTISEGFGYVGQDCWLRRGSIRDNILCDNVYRPDFYKTVLNATALDHDISQIPGRDEHLIGDEGTTLSGGQRARLALARAIYQDNNIVLLDDPFASLDARVADFIYENCIETLLKAKGKSVILCTHHTKYLRQVDEIIRLNEMGEIISRGSPSQILRELNSPERYNNFISISLSTKKTETNAPFDNPEHIDTPLTDVDENKEEGTVKISIYCSYLKATGYGLAAMIFIALLSMQISKNGSDVWLSEWTKNSSIPSTSTKINFNSSIGNYNNNNNQLNWNYFLYAYQPRPLTEKAYNRTIYFLQIYVIVALFNTIFTLIRAFLFAYGGIKATKYLHDKLLNRVLYSTIAWWDGTPWGRVVNRLCADVYTVDDSLPFQLNICLASFVNLLGALVITLLALPYLMPLVIILLILYYFIQRYYRFANCEVKRISSLTLSPLYSHITDTVTGLVTIRAHRFTERFTRILRDRLDNNLRAQYSALAASQWLSVRLQMLGVVMVSAIAFTGVIESRYLNVETGLIALAITYALSLTNILSSLLCSFIDTEKELVSVERICDYIENLPTEETSSDVENLDKFLFCRVVKGQIDFTCVSLRYASNLPLALKNVTFRIEAGQRVGIIGRTGAGKSSIFQALLRAHPIETGKIFIDGGTIDIMQMDPRAVRSMFGFVSQTPFIFSGTIRENLTVNNWETITDYAILSVLSQAGLDNWLERCGGLYAEVTEGGHNFSFGEKQIICLCRLILAKPKIVLIDEATAHMDEEKHLIMNKLIRTLLPGTTVISIVHRTTGLEEFDWIIELSNGAIHRQGRPSAFAS